MSRKLRKVLTIRLEENGFDQVRRLYPSANIPYKLKDHLIHNYSTQPQMCALHKVHKEGLHSDVLY